MNDLLLHLRDGGVGLPLFRLGSMKKNKHLGFTKSHIAIFLILKKKIFLCNVNNVPRTRKPFSRNVTPLTIGLELEQGNAVVLMRGI